MHWEHIFSTGEFMPRERLLAGLSLEQVTARPGGAPHSIYDELWHAAEWQRIVVERDEDRGAAFKGANAFPTQLPRTLQDWEALVEKFLRGNRAAQEWGKSLEGPGEELEPGWSAADELVNIALHNAYHLGKVVALRQVLGAWPPA